MDLQHLRASDGTGEAVLAHVQSVRNIGSTVLDLDNVDNWNSKCVVVTGTPNANGFIATAGMTVMYGHLNAGDFIIDGYAPGYSDNGNTTTEVAIVKMTTNWADTLVELFGSEHKDNGKHKDITADSILLNDGNVIGNQFLYANAIINSACLVAQRYAVPNISTTYQYGKVDRFAAKATGTAVSAGTINQNTSSLVAATKGAEIKLAGVTVTGTGIIYLRYRMEAKEAQMFKNQAASFAVRVHHDVGSSVNATIYIRKANSADNFAAVTDIANSGAIAVPNNTGTLIKFENINSGSLGDCSNGLEIEIQLACGAVTTKNFSFGEFQFNKGAKASPFQPRHIQQDTSLCQRYYLVVRNPSQNYSVFATAFVTGQRFTVSTPVPMRTTPTIVNSGLGMRFGGADYTLSSLSITSMTPYGIDFIANTSGSPGNGNIGGVWTANQSLYLDSEL